MNPVIAAVLQGRLTLFKSLASCLVAGSTAPAVTKLAHSLAARRLVGSARSTTIVWIVTVVVLAVIVWGLLSRLSSPPTAYTEARPNASRSLSLCLMLSDGVPQFALCLK